MDSFEGKRAVVTGGGSGMGRELVAQLAAAGCSVATCDLHPAGLTETLSRAEAAAPVGTMITTHLCDVSDEAQVLRFHDEVTAAHGEVLELMFNTAGIGGGGSLIADSREDWERTFAVDFWGVYYCTRAFLPNLIGASEAVLVNTSSVNGFWASLGPGIPHTAYSTAKFAVKGLSESLIEDFRVNAPHVHVAVVMPGHIGTDIVANSRRYFGRPEPDALTESDLEETRKVLSRRGIAAGQFTSDQLRDLVKMLEEGFRDGAPLDAAGAAHVILDGVLAGKWRILVGDDAHRLDESVRADPEGAYEHQGVGISPLSFGGDFPGGMDQGPAQS
ncbi:MAG TPA: SDR family NAD(P)-dependent oxidoreductase [Acidimicrobiales bacterium]|nr:SDR family NAD(P)-dependent oxidoreductase [Acidimicrobiales bacterium]